MRLSFFGALVMTLIGAVIYLYLYVALPCPIPLTYSLGALDERFGLSEAAAEEAVEQAVAIWEESTETNLFELIPEGGKLTVNFIYDERQQLETTESTFAARLAEGKNANEALTAAYGDAVAKYEAANTVYKARLETYERTLTQFNKTVEKYNREGGAPPDEFERLEEEKSRLADEARQLENESEKLQAMVDVINDLSEKGAELVSAYNNSVATYNDRFGDAREFTQGDYQDNQIHIYTFESKAELIAVLVHELGHSLSLEHVENSSSMMHYLMDEQVNTLSLSDEDLEEYKRVCEVRPLWQVWLYKLHRLV